MVAIPELHVGRPARFGPLTVFPVWTAAAMASDLVTGDAATINVAERKPQPAVGELVLTNTGSQPALLVEGELLEGGWQHRALVNDVVLAAGQTLVAAVACVEAGRWNGTAHHARRARRGSPRVRAALNANAAYSRQQEVWARVAEYDTSLGYSPSSSYVDHLNRLESPTSLASELLTEAAHFEPLPGQTGAIIGLAGRPLALELYPSPVALGAHLGELLGSFVLDAVARSEPAEAVPGCRAREFAERLHNLVLTRRKGNDAGEALAVGFDSHRLLARGSVLGRRWAHLSVFNRRHPLLLPA
jgi:hypothetical protein